MVLPEQMTQQLGSYVCAFAGLPIIPCTNMIATNEDTSRYNSTPAYRAPEAAKQSDQRPPEGRAVQPLPRPPSSQMPPSTERPRSRRSAHKSSLPTPPPAGFASEPQPRRTSLPHATSISSNTIHPPPTPTVVYVELLVFPDDLPGHRAATEPPQAYITLTQGPHHTPIAELCNLIRRCPQFRPYLNALEKRHTLTFSITKSRRNLDECDRWMIAGTPDVWAGVSDEVVACTGDMQQLGPSGVVELWCLAELGAGKNEKRPSLGKLGMKEAAVRDDGTVLASRLMAFTDTVFLYQNVAVADITQALKKTDFRFGKIFKFGSAGKIGVE
ncbi:uncharacterized protein EV422DRAFT_405431 [Fimicolochytrium jonesii]|uniref:uncharacterized protein n=1 Tax=Fimicolochytrium jonesii TaxID=1396493 RepID=UPI0022FE7162|nr:uncharacterized protein EV422DRAFT_405431 [Fimicolochytrium jonesii]KAI8822590.1 hypothetical protein EV422DRAFT_405431 [Fimicolochytrium jonesii]